MTRAHGKRQDMEQAAVRLFARKGVMQTTVRDIAREAGVTDGALYRHYPSKEDMAWSLFQREASRFAEGFRTVLARKDADVRERIAAAVEYTLAYSESFPQELAFVLLTRHSFAPERGLAPEDNPVRLVNSALDDAVARGELPPCRTSLLTAMIMGVVLHPMELQRYHEPGNEKNLNKEDKRLLAAGCLALLPKVAP